jgi:hypothetical protein
MDKISKFTFYYITPICLGFITGLSIRDSLGLNISKKISMSLADYYEKIDEDVDESIRKDYPEVEKLLKKINKTKY